MKVLFNTLITLLFIIAPAQAKNSPAYITSDVSAIKTGDELRISFRIHFNKKATKQGYKLIITPTIQDCDLRNNLTEIEVLDRKAEIIDYRKKLSKSKKDKPGKKLIFRAVNGDDIQYYTSIPFESWMSKSSLTLNAFFQGCCKTNILKTDTLLTALNLTRHLSPRFSQCDMIPIAQVQGEELKKWSFNNETPQINFIQGQTEIEPDYLNNNESLAEINHAIREIARDPNNIFRIIEISGFSSPEGNSEYNSELSANRAISLKKYIQQQIPDLHDDNFRLVNGHENWAELREYVEKSKMPQKKDILNIIDNTRPDEGLKEKLMNYQNGYAYMYMVHNFFPLLRNACSLSIFYISPECYSNENIENGIILLREKKYAEALPLLMKEKENPLLLNAIGICYMMTNNWEEAKKYFQKAIEKGSSDALINLDMIE